ncbi:hypothetical protein B0T24DRAFT_358712 [Lasiosphaeria ovina]|uniref:Zn(2)-C6 fungal-type domain-containing protein n=1 Tax=Lasiosphaeria ovina TaxID=92902 RepID=A0AAE0K375_9PEZI|nr:hypothetical protein B0T24DRAFT_358712 [Lasiosphaeria ovina]
MEPPAAAHESLPVSVPAPRQKNCNTCVQGKRRCDRRMPVCSRCQLKKIPCTYTKTKTTAPASGTGAALVEVEHAGEPHPPSGAPDYSPASAFLFAPAAMALDPGFSLDLDLDLHLGLDQNYIGGVPPCASTSVMDFMDRSNSNTSPANPARWLVSADDALLTDRPSSPADVEEMTIAFGKMGGLCDKMQPWHLYDPQTPLSYVFSRTKAFTTDMATRNATPFLHQCLYRTHTPPSIMSCFATTVLYANRTPATTPMVMRALHGSALELISAETGRANGNAATPLEKLARAQALFHYQIIRLLDGDVSLRAQGEKDMPLLMAWLADLCKLRDNLSDAAQLDHADVRALPPKNWENWIFAESVRRTILMAYSVMSMFELMKDPADAVEQGPGPWALVHRWTLARGLWDASGPFEFERRWRETPHFVMANYSFDRFLEHGRGDDVDEFAEILLCAYMGVDATREFMTSSQRQAQQMA